MDGWHGMSHMVEEKIRMPDGQRDSRWVSTRIHDYSEGSLSRVDRVDGRQHADRPGTIDGGGWYEAGKREV
jgi:hypothetical protein